MENKKLKLVLSYDIQDMEGNSQVSENFLNTYEVMLPVEEVKPINFAVLHTSTWLVLQHLREQILENKQTYSEFLYLGLKAFLKTGCQPDFAKETRTRLYKSLIKEMENSHNECPLTLSLDQYYDLKNGGRL
ncbi:hypothetical protein [Flavobacterium psychrophilum]|uniref:hypothetical protein n=1 Tax=Flavobacterium psychrophilum TaxID=96345 RepID=UPI0006187A47|nr:hypothetical protein [Flavobacterium psychrophilum]ELY1979222.1 hypothetical protein [Flavobacterium psychrophilum]ELY2011101.1 hypothetical protein [Flavobacterium psychrophilum]OAE90302.1 hypothetical protein SU65_11175 [Flavobacterium psychrophilum]